MRRERAARVMLASSLLLAQACVTTTLMDVHWNTLGDLASDLMQCPEESLTPTDETPEDMMHFGNDPDARRYIVRGCGQESAFVCFSVRMGHREEVPECRPLRRDGEGSAGGGVYIGPFRVN